MSFHSYSSLGEYMGSELLFRRLLGAQYWAVDLSNFLLYWKLRSIKLDPGADL